MARHAPPRSAGFTLVELLITMVVVAVVMGAATVLFTSMNELSRAQIHQADMQQAVRVTQREITRTVQMAGRGGLAGWNDVGPAYSTPAIALRNNVGDPGSPFTDRSILEGGGAGVPTALTGTDILTVRGAFNSSVLHLDWTDPTAFDVAAGTIRVSTRTPTGIPQNLQPLADAVADNIQEALVIVNAVDELDYAVVALNPATSTFADCAADAWDDPTLVCTATVGFTTAGGLAASYVTLSPGGVLPGNFGQPTFRPAFLGIVEEYRYYIREDADPDGNPIYRLSRARVYPATQQAYRDDPVYLREDLADHLFDLQVALGFDSSYWENGATNGFFAADIDFPPPATGGDDLIWDNGDESDDWLFNAADDVGTLEDLPWSPDLDADPPGWTVGQPQPVLYYARVTTAGRTARPDRGFQADLLVALEDHEYPEDHPLNEVDARLHRQEILRSVIDVRNF